MASGTRTFSLILLLVCCAACAPRAAPAPTTTAQGTERTLPTPLSQFSPTVTATAASLAATQTLRPASARFTENFDGPVPHWTYQQAGNGQPMAAPVIRDGFLVFSLTARDQWAYALYDGPESADVTIEARVQDRTGGDGAAGIVCRYDKSAGWYELDVFADGTYRLLYGRWLTAGIASYTPLYGGESDALSADENDIGLQCRGNSLAPSINGQALKQWQELKFGLKQGRVGLSVSSFEDVPFTVGFDWVKVAEP